MRDRIEVRRPPTPKATTLVVELNTRARNCAYPKIKITAGSNTIVCNERTAQKLRNALGIMLSKIAKRRAQGLQP